MVVLVTLQITSYSTHIICNITGYGIEIAVDDAENIYDPITDVV